MHRDIEQMPSAVAPAKEREIMVRFRTRFHATVLFTELQCNMERTLVDRGLAVGDPEPKMFLPAPWPPFAIESEEDLQKAALLKMVHIVNVGLNLKAESATEVEALIQQAFPQRQNLGRNDLYSCEVSIVEDGGVVYHVELPDPSRVHPSLCPDERGKHPFAKAMIILSLRRDLEKLQR